MSLDIRSFPRFLGVCLFFFISTALFASGCSTTSSMSYKPADKVIEMTKGPCYGRCPVFTLTIYKNGLVSYKGERYTDRLGTYEKKLKKKELQSIIDEFKRANFWQFRDTYRGMIPDMQSVSITYIEDGKKKTVTGKEIRPNAVKWLESQLDQIANSEEGWKLIEAPEESVPDYLIPNELIVELEEGADPEEWAKKYIQADMLFEKQLADSGYWIFSFDDGLIVPEEMLEQVRQDEQVISAEFNKEIYNKLDEEKEKEEGSDTTIPTVDRKKKKNSSSWVGLR
jgi:hypothetical protein